MNPDQPTTGELALNRIATGYRLARNVTFH